MKNNKTNKNHKKTNKAVKTTNKPLPTNNTRFLDLTLDAVFKHFFKTNKNLCSFLKKQ